MKETAFLVVKADRSMRIAKRPRLAADEVAIRLTINFPDAWGRVIADLTVDLPDEPPVATIEPVEDQS